MIYKGKFKIIDNLITACDYAFLLNRIEESMVKKYKLLVSPIASHTLVRAHYNLKLKNVLNKFDYLVPDSQWVKRSISFLYGKKYRLKKRVYGPDLMLRICKKAEKNKWLIFFYGTNKRTLDMLNIKIRRLFPKLIITGFEPSKYRELKDVEIKSLSKLIKKRKVDIIFIAIGSPNQEILGYKLSKFIKGPLIIVVVGAAFDFISGIKRQAKKWMQEWGIEWAYRLIQEPKRLLFRYSCLSLIFINRILFSKLKSVLNFT